MRQEAGGAFKVDQGGLKQLPFSIQPCLGFQEVNKGGLPPFLAGLAAEPEGQVWWEKTVLLLTLPHAEQRGFHPGGGLPWGCLRIDLLTHTRDLKTMFKGILFF